MKKTVLLCIMDGFGIAPDSKGNAVYLAKKHQLPLQEVYRVILRAWEAC